tara:strand:+ start:64 stop:1554 length:1491 start_codon:yes stop_codon:yes gene_type:complete
MITENNFSLNSKYDAVLIGAGIMSASLALLIKEVCPEINILVIEQLSTSAQESSGAFNNAGTGHAANCELNYTPLDNNNLINLEKALEINNSFEQSLNLWAYLYDKEYIDIKKFLTFVPHISFVNNSKDVDFLKRRFELMKKCREFQDMEFTTSHHEISNWSPLIMKDRDKEQKIAATRLRRGTDINFEALTKEYFNYLSKKSNFEISYKTKLVDLKRIKNHEWELYINQDGNTKILKTNFVFIGAGGKTINLLQKSNIPESRNYGGFPVSGKWLISENKELNLNHYAKVYSKAPIGSPPMSVPHLDSRWISGKKYLLFGPFAGFTTKFLKKGSYFDLFDSFKKDNLLPIFDVGFKNLELIKYLLSQSTKSHSSRIKDLQEIMPSACKDDWYLKNAGQRVQIIKKTEIGGTLKFGTEIVNSSDRSLFALLGASPGASTAINIMLKVLKESNFYNNNDKLALDKKINKLIPLNSVTLNLNDLENIKRRNNNILGFHH